MDSLPDGTEVTPEEAFDYAAQQWRIPIYLTGPIHPEANWCATCVALFIDATSRDKSVQKWVKKQHDAAVRNGLSACVVELQESEHMQLQPAITVGYSYLFNPGTGYHFPMEVCWTHVQGYHWPTQEEREAGQPYNQPQQSAMRLIPGKRYGPVREQGT